MKTKFNYNSEQKKQLSKLALRGLKDKINLLPDVSSMYHEKLDTKRKFQKYENILTDEINILKTIRFDGYILMLFDIVNYARQSNISITCYGSIQNSLIAYLLDIIDTYTLKSRKDFINFIPFEKKPTLYIVADFSRYDELVSFVEAKYSKQIKKVKKRSIKFNDNLKIKFIDLGIDKEVILKENDVQDLGLKIIQTNINTAQRQAIFTKTKDKNKKNAWLKKRKVQLSLGLESLNIGDMLIDRILMARDGDKYNPFKSIDDFKNRVPVINEVDKKTQKIVFDNLQKDLDKMNKLKEDLKNYKKKMGVKNDNI
jgi:DNA polymerase III alpha subunit